MRAAMFKRVSMSLQDYSAISKHFIPEIVRRAKKGMKLIYEIKLFSVPILALKA